MTEDKVKTRLDEIAGQLTYSDVSEEIANPDWDEDCGWARWVDEEVQELWSELSEESRLVAFIAAHRLYEVEESLRH